MERVTSGSLASKTLKRLRLEVIDSPAVADFVSG